jgi:serine/threonine-protein kinase
MPLAAGTRLGPYEITAKIGEGGMGEVYRATDTNLKRAVAIKVLPEAVAEDSERLARFRREGEVLASLNHPHIAAIYGLERSGKTTALVMELVEGPTLAERVERGPIPLQEALAIARQIAEALAAAHECGIIHRDLKPANVKVRVDGTVKVLDLGLAKSVEPTGISASGSHGATITSPAMTQAGIILGTAAYISPEQAAGKPADTRSDIWAFGCVLYEMLAGTRAFDGDSVHETLANVLKSDPEWSRLPADVPASVFILIRGCLVKDRRRRVSDMSTATFILGDPGGAGVPLAATARTASRPSRWRRALPIGSAVAATAIVAGTTTWALRPRPRPPGVVQFSFTPQGQSFTGTVHQIVAVSPDGTRVAYTANGRLYVRSLGELESHALTDTETAISFNPVFQPDGDSIVFMTALQGIPVVKRIPFNGGASLTLATLDGIPNFSGASWSRDGILLGAVGGARRGILRVSPSGGAPERIIGIEEGWLVHGPQMLPDGHTVLFTLTKATGDNVWENAQVVAQSLKGGPRRVLIEAGSDARYLRTGHLVYAVSGTVYAVPFNARTVEVTGTAVPVISGVRRAIGGVSAAAQFSISETGTLAYVPGPVSTARGLVVGTSGGDLAALKVPPATYVHPRVSPDGQTVAVVRNDGQSSDIWTYDLSGKAEIKRLTFEGASRFPVWSADSRRVTFQGRDRAIWWQPVSGGPAERLTSPAEGEAHVPESWSRDGTRLLFSVHKGSMLLLWVFRLNGRKIERFGDAGSAESLSASFSPDGRWVAYASTSQAGGTLSPNRGIFVEPYPPTGERHQVPKRLVDYHPLWAPDGKSIFYVPGSNIPIVSVPITTHPIAFGAPVELARAPLPGLLSVDIRGYDLFRDGRILSISPWPGGTAGVPPAEIRVVLNWFEELKRLVPSN